MKNCLWFAFICCLLGTVLTVPVAADAPVPYSVGGSAPIPMDQLGNSAQKQYFGDGIGITPTANGAHLKALFQRLEAEATPEGLWLSSTAKEETETNIVGPKEKFRIRAMALGRGEGHFITLPNTGEVRASKDVAAWLRHGVIEEYTTSMDGIRQDFVVPVRPGGAALGSAGELILTLELTGVRAESGSVSDGVKLIVAQSRRELIYNRLRVTDSNGRELPSRMEPGNAGGTLQIRVDDRGATYPMRVDPMFSDADWVSLGGIPGIDGEINALVLDGAGNLYAGGSFGISGNTTANSVACWNGSSWSALGSGLRGRVSALTLDGSGNLYAGGDFYLDAEFTDRVTVARWNGSSWSALGTGMDFSVNALVVDGSGNLYAGGDFTEAGGNAANYIARWNGNSWSALGRGMDGSVKALAVDGSGNLYSGGSFTTRIVRSSLSSQTLPVIVSSLPSNT